MTARRYASSTTVAVSLVAWGVAVMLVCGSLLARHLLPLPASSARVLAPDLAALRTPGERLTVFHVLYADCRCSRRIAEGLATSRRPDGVREHVLLVDDAGPLRALLERRGFVLHDVRSEDLEPRFGVASAPSFIVATSDGAVRYSGGYTASKQALASHDRDVIDAVAAGKTPEPLPIYGCAVAASLEKERNPLRLP